MRRGFAAWHPAKLKAVASKGGKKKGRKGFALLDEDDHKRLSAKGGRISRKRLDNKRKRVV